jgi:hypothetical protein
MVYEFLPITIRHHILEDPICRMPSTIALVTKSLPVELLAVCRIIYSEARPSLQRKQDALGAEPLRLLINATSEHLLFQAKGLLAYKSLFYHIGEQREDIRYNGLAQRGLNYLQDATFHAMTQLHDVNAFTRKVAVYVETRSPSSTIIAFRQHPDHQLKEFFTIMDCCSASARRAAIRKVNNVWPGPLDFMPRGSNATGPGVVSVLRTNTYMSRENTKASISAREDQLWVEDVEEDEWKRNWEEGGVFE